MVQETAATPVQDDGFRGAAEVAEAPAPTAEVEGAAVEAKETEPTAPASWDDLEQTEWFPATLEEKRSAWIEEAKPEILKEAKSAAMREFDPHMQRQTAAVENIAAAAAQLAEVGQSVFQRIRNEARKGTLDADALQDIAADHPAFARFLNGNLFQVDVLVNSGTDRALDVLAKASGSPGLKEDMYARLRNDPMMTNEEFAREYLQRLTEASLKDRVKDEVAKARKPLEDENAKLKAQVNEMKGKLNTNEGPSGLPATAGGSGANYSTLAEARTLHAQHKISNAEMLAAKRRLSR